MLPACIHGRFDGLHEFSRVNKERENQVENPSFLGLDRQREYNDLFGIGEFCILFPHHLIVIVSDDRTK